MVANIETDKVTVPVNSPVSGTVTERFAKEGDTVEVGADLFKIELGSPPSKTEAHSTSGKKETESQAWTDNISKMESKSDGEQKDLIKSENINENQTKAPEKISLIKPTPQPEAIIDGREEQRIPMNRMRLRIAERMKESQQTAASLTTFNEVDMSAIISIRTLFKEAVMKKHSIKLGFMSPFVKAATTALLEIPNVNARIEENEIIYNNFVDISVAVATPKVRKSMFGASRFT